MRRFTPVNKLAHSLSWLVAIILALLPFHAFLTIWLSSLVGHYTLLRLWKEFLLVPIVLGSLYILWKDPSLRRRFFGQWLVRLILIYCLLLVVSAAIARLNHAASAKAMWYGLLVDLRFLAFFLAVLVIASGSDWLGLRWRKILLGPAIIVTAFAILQYLVLPYDFLRHFGYGDSTIRPYEAISHTTAHLRVASTTRGANSLGGYMIIPLTFLAAVFFKEKTQRLNKSLLAGGFLLALIFSFSRSGWIGALAGALAAVGLSRKTEKSKKAIKLVLLVGLITVITVAIAMRNNTNFQDIFLHTDHTSKIVTSSNSGHTTAAKLAIKDIARHPLGGGVGSAGPQSVYNDHPARIAENYFLQIGQEAGMLGVALFVTICVLAGKMLYERRADPLALVVFASLVGLSLVNLLSHAWADDTLAYIWWGLSAIALSPVIIDAKHNHQNGKKIKTA
jgi:hypothetical protein